MDLAMKLPTMDDSALAILYANAERLKQTGTSAQQSAAAALMPSIKAELAARSAAKRSMTKAKPPIVKRAMRGKPTAAAAVEH
jgi:hypothetical protein